MLAAATPVGLAFGGHPLMTKQKMWLSKPRRYKFLQPNRCRRMTTRKLSHVSDSRSFDSCSDVQSLAWSHVQRRRTVDGFPVFTGFENRQRSIPLRRKVEDRVDIFASDQAAKTGDRNGIELFGNAFRFRENFTANCGYFESIRKGPEGRRMSRLPLIAQANQSNSEFHFQWGRFLTRHLNKFGRLKTHPTKF
jgi:hypothetical protein